MKKIFLLIFAAYVLISCNSISTKPIFESLSTDELTKAIKTDTSFTSFYENLRKSVDEISDIKKAKYHEVTYRRLFKYFKFTGDTVYWKAQSNTAEKEWAAKFAIYLPKADSVLDYWRRYQDEHSLNKYVQVELAEIDKEYYEYIGSIKEVHLGFKLIPLQGPIEQIRFTYGFKVKINGDDKYYEKHSCISTSPFSSSNIRYWEVGYSDRDIFAGKNVETFLRDYNLYIEITDIRKGGINITADDYLIPDKVKKCLEYEKKYPELFELYKEDLITDMINKDFVSKWEFIIKKENEIKKKYDKLCFDFSKDL